MIDAAKITAALSLIAFTLGCSFNYGYFRAIGFNDFMLLTYKDHLASAVYFAPPTLATALLGVLARPWKYYDTVGCVVLGATILLWTGFDPALAAVGPIAEHVVFVLEAILTALGLCYLTSVIIDRQAFWNFADEASAARSGAILLGAVSGLILFTILGGILSYRNTMDAKTFDVDIIFAKDAGLDSGQVRSLIVRIVDNGVFLVTQKDPARLVFARREVVNVISQKIDIR